MGGEAGRLGQRWTGEAGLLPIGRRAGGNTSMYIYLRKIILRSWTGEDGGREPTQKAGAEIQGSSIVGLEGYFARHLGIRTGRNGWAMEEVREAGHPLVSGSASCMGGDAIHCEGIGWGEKPGSASRGRQHWSGT